MKINGPQFELLSQFNSNWEQNQRRLCFDLSREEIRGLETHPLSGEITSLIEEKGGSLPFFLSGKIIWCTMAPDPSRLKRTVEQLQSWILPSYGWQGGGDGYKTPDPSGGAFQQAISGISPVSYFRWQSMSEQYPAIERKLAIRYQLEEKRPDRARSARPSLYELRTQFHIALTLGARAAAEKAIDLIDTYELDKALNTQMMRIRLWHHFREFECIKNCRNLPYLQAQPSLPNSIREYIREAIGEVDLESGPIEESVTQHEEEEIGNDWGQWFEFLINQKDAESSRNWLDEKKAISVEELKQDQIKLYSELWDSIFINDDLKIQHKSLINEALVTFLGDFAREPEFPRSSFAELYLSLLRLWGELNAGIGIGREEGHVLLELASALFELNHEIDEAKKIIEEWWKARPVPSQLPFALDAIELLACQHPNQEAPAHLWLEAAELVRREPERLTPSEKELWRSVGYRLGMDEATVLEYLPPEEGEEAHDILGNAGLQRVAIVCTRERQARTASKDIAQRSGAEVVIVASTKAGLETEKALTADVVLFVWMATTHAVFRAFDGFDRNRLCYVQGTGAMSIVRALERWAQINAFQADQVLAYRG